MPKLPLSHHIEPWRDRRREIYILDEPVRHLIPFLEEVAMKSLRNERVSNEAKRLGYDFIRIRLALLKAMRLEILETGGFTTRMILAAIKHIEWLIEADAFKALSQREAEELVLQALDWGRRVFLHMPMLGWTFMSIVLKCLGCLRNWTEDVLLYASVFAAQAATCLKMFSGFPDLEEKLRGLEGLLERIEASSKMPSTSLAYVTWAWAEIAFAWDRLAFGAEKANEAINRAVNLLRSLEGLTRDLALISAACSLCEYLLEHGKIDEAIRWLSEAREALKKLERELKEPRISGILAKYLRPYGLFLKKQLKRLIISRSSGLAFLEGRLRLDKCEFMAAIDAFRQAWIDARRLKLEENALIAWSWYVRTQIIRDGLETKPEDLEGRRLPWQEHFTLIWTKAEKLWNVGLLTSETYTLCYMEFCLADLLKTGLYHHLNLKPLEKAPSPPRYQPLFLGTYYCLCKIAWKSDVPEDLSRLIDWLLRRWETELLAREKYGMFVHSAHYLSSILLALSEDDLERAALLAYSTSLVLQAPLPKRLFSELSDALRTFQANTSDEKARERLVEALVKLFYYHI